MQIYLVGGAVRERLLGRPVRERDFVVVGASAREMLDLGYRQVGRDFPVFLHPESHEEYALARTLRTALPGNDKVPYGDPSVSLEEDLARRDLTINALAEDQDGRLIDPFGGERDLRSGVLRHISPAFAEDPLRVLRVARFMARYRPLGFRVAPETRELMETMAATGTLDGLVAERVWKELAGALGEGDPPAFFETLRECGALARVLPEIDALFGVPQPVGWHPEVDCGAHTLMALTVACELSPELEVRFAVLTHDLGKATTPGHLLPSHHGHEGRGERLVEQLCRRLKVPAGFRELALRCAIYHGYTHRLYELRPRTLYKLLCGLDAFRRPAMLHRFLRVCEADYRGRRGFYQRGYPQAGDLWSLYQVASQVSGEGFAEDEPGRLRGERVRRERIRRIAEFLSRLRAPAGVSAGQAAEDSETRHVGADEGTEAAEEKHQQGA